MAKYRFPGIIQFEGQRSSKLRHVFRLLDRAPGHRRLHVVHVEAYVRELHYRPVMEKHAVALDWVFRESRRRPELPVDLTGHLDATRDDQRL